ncbi:hypothetical protein [Agrobacterium radiobacter]|uniref:hypothetical protein n=1 Tax=Agrobacterium radiobacter TaxID=362 RepID=UPI00138F0C1D|nr:hypothetical protein [Agrobacterium radiobacter]
MANPVMKATGRAALRQESFAQYVSIETSLQNGAFTNWIRTLAKFARFCQNPRELRQLCCPKFDRAGLNTDFAGSENSCRAGSSHETMQVILQEGQK